MATGDAAQRRRRVEIRGILAAARDCRRSLMGRQRLDAEAGVYVIGAIMWGIAAFTDGVCIFLTFVGRLEVARDITGAAS